MRGPTIESGAADVEERAPLDVAPDVGEAWVGRLTLAFVVLGVALRLVRYGLNFPLWCDETMLAANLLERDYAGLLRPLDYRQACPVLFLLIERAAVGLLGFSEASLRLFPLLCGVGGMLLFRLVAGRVVRGRALLFAVAILAVSNWPLKYVAEVKPYASDLFASLVLLSLGVECWRRPGRAWPFWALAAVAPLAVALSFPAVFVAGGVGLALAGVAWRSGRRGVWLGYAAFNAAIVATFVYLLRFYQTAPGDHDYFHRDWASAFPPLNSLGRFVAWFVSNNTGFMFAYPEGGANGASALTTICFVAALVVLWRRGRTAVLALLLAPFGLGLAAAALHRYPYGMNPRTMQYLAPAICLGAGIGAAWLSGLIRVERSRRRVQAGFLVVLGLLATGRFAFDLVYPYRAVEDARHREFARWFWREKARDGELVCPKADLDLEFQPGHWGRDATDSYLCYQKIYSARHAAGAGPRLDAVSAARPLRLVFFNEIPERSPAFNAWLAEVSGRFELRQRDRYIVSAPVGSKTAWDTLYLVYEFTPRPGVTDVSLPRLPAALARGEGRGATR